MKKILFFSICFLSLGITKTVKAQFGFGKPEDIQQVKQRKLIVIIEQPNKDLMQKLRRKGKTDEIKEYQDALDQYNAEMKEVVSKFWSFSANDIVYMTPDAVDKLHHSHDYAVLYCATNDGYGSEHLDWSPGGKDKIKTDGYTQMCVELLEKSKPIYVLGIPDIFPSKADLVYGVTAIEYYFNYRLSHVKASRKEVNEMLQQNQSILAHRTLLLRQDEISKKLKPEDIKKAYPYPYRVVSEDDMDQYVINADSNYAYTIIAPYVGDREVIYVQYVYDCKDGTVLGMSMPSYGAMMLGGYTGGAGHTEITKKTLADFCKYISGKKN